MANLSEFIEEEGKGRTRGGDGRKGERERKDPTLVE